MTRAAAPRILLVPLITLAFSCDGPEAGSTAPPGAAPATGPVQRAASAPVIDGDARAAFVLDHLADTTVYLSYNDARDHPRGVRDFTVHFYSRLFPREPMAHYADGTPAGTERVIGPDVLQVIVEELALDGFFAKCVRWHSEATPQPATPPPADSRAFDPTFWATTYPSGALTVRVAVSTRDWHHNFEQAYPLDRDVRNVLIRIADRVPDDVRGDLEAGLLSKMR